MQRRLVCTSFRRARLVIMLMLMLMLLLTLMLKERWRDDGLGMELVIRFFYECEIEPHTERCSRRGYFF